MPGTSQLDSKIQRQYFAERQTVSCVTAEPSPGNPRPLDSTQKLWRFTFYISSARAVPDSPVAPTPLALAGHALAASCAAAPARATPVLRDMRVLPLFPCPSLGRATENGGIGGVSSSVSGAAAVSAEGREKGVGAGPATRS